MNSTCKVYNRNTQNLNEFQCGLMKFEADLYYYDFGYICMGPLTLIVVISIFGKIKENYRWLILNQAIWDLLLCVNYSCYNAISIGVKLAPSCFYMTKTYFANSTNFSRNFDNFASDSIMYNSFSSLFLLTTLRLLALYFPRIYDKLTKAKRIFFTIVLFHIFIMIFDINPLFVFLQVNRLYVLLDECALQQNMSVCVVQKDYENDSWYKTYLTLSYIFMHIKYFKPILFMFFSIIAATMLIWKIMKQAKFQFKHNRKDFNASIRITVVVCLQIVINCFVFIIEIFCKFIPGIISVLKLKIRTSRNNVIDRDYTGYLDMRLPVWFDSIYGLTNDNSRQMIVQFRILIETFIVLTIMTGYREALMDFLKFFMEKVLRHPLEKFTCFKFHTKKPNVSQNTLFL